MTINELLKAAREQSGLTQVELAQRLRKSQSLITAYETSRRSPGTAFLKRIHNATGINFALVDGEWTILTNKN